MTTPVTNPSAQSGSAAVSLAVSTVIFALGPDANQAASQATGTEASHTSGTVRARETRHETGQRAGLQTGEQTGEQTGPSVRSLRLPLVRRIREPYKGLWALPGGPLHADEDLEVAARRNLRNTTALTPRYLEQLYAFGTVDRSPADRVVSIVYWALVQSSEAAIAAQSDNVRWFDADAVPPLAFDHNTIVDYALWRLRTKLEYSRIAHALLGDTFTLTQLREVHEAVLGRALDPANFRRMIESSDSLIATDQYLTGASHRPPRLYRYNPDVALADRGPLAQS